MKTGGGKVRGGWSRSWLSAGWCVPELSTADDKASKVGSGWVARSYHVILHLSSLWKLHKNLNKQPFFFSVSILLFVPISTSGFLLHLLPRLHFISLRLLPPLLLLPSYQWECRQTALSALCVCALVLTTDNSGYCLSVDLSVYQTSGKEMPIAPILIRQIALSPPSPNVYVPNCHQPLCLFLFFSPIHSSLSPWHEAQWIAASEIRLVGALSLR